MVNLDNLKNAFDKQDLEKPSTLIGKAIYYSTLFLLVLMLVLSVAVIWFDILVPNAIYINLVEWALALSLAIFVLWVYSAFIGDTFMRRNMEKTLSQRGKRKWPVILGMALVFPIIFVLGFAKGIPLTEHYIFAKDAEIMLTVDRKGSSYYSKHCSGELYFREYPYLFNDSICGIQKADWEAIHAGQKIVLIGDQSHFGFVTKSYRVESDSPAK